MKKITGRQFFTPLIGLLSTSVIANDSINDEYPYSVPAGYQLVLDEKFDGSEYDSSVWTPMTYGNGVGNAEMQYYQPENLSVNNGVLDITAKNEVRFDNTGIVQHNFTSGRLSTIGKKAFRYGKIAIRADVPDVPGTHFAFWLGAFDVNVQGFPTAGNMDIVQTGIYGQFEEVEGHFQFGTEGDNLQDMTRFYHSGEGFNAADGFHIYEIEWTPLRVTFMVDGQQTGTIFRNGENDDAFDNYYYLAVNMGLQSEYSIYGGNQSYDLANALPETAKVDWIKVWQHPLFSDVKTNYASSQPHTKIEGGNFVLSSDNTPAIYRYAYTEGQFLAFWTPNITLVQHVDEYDFVYPLLPLKQALQADAYEGGAYNDYSISHSGGGWNGGGWYSEYPIDLSAFAEEGSLVMYLKSEQELGFFNVGMIDTVGGQFEMSYLSAGNFEADGQWHKLEFPLSAFAEHVDLSTLLYPLYLVSSEPSVPGETLSYGVDNIYFKWKTDDTLVYPSPVDKTLVFNFEFDEPKPALIIKLKVDGEMQPPIIVHDAQESINEDGSATYLWHSCLSYPAGSVVEAQVKGIGESGFDYFPGEAGDFSAPYTVVADGESGAKFHCFFQ